MTSKERFILLEKKKEAAIQITTKLIKANQLNDDQNCCEHINQKVE